MVKKDISVSELRKKYPTLFHSVHLTALDNGCRINNKYVIKGIDSTKFMLAEKFLLSIKGKKIEEIVKKYGLSKTIESMTRPKEKALREFAIGEYAFYSGIAKKSKGAKEANKIIIIMSLGKWDGIMS